MSDKLVGRFVSELKLKQEELAHAAMQFPKSDAFEHGVQVGVYRGLDFALDLLNGILSDNLKEESQS